MLEQDDIIERKRIYVTYIKGKENTQKIFEHMQFKEWLDHSTPNIHN